MAATGYTPITLYYTTTASAVPVNTNLVNGELAINITDGKLYYKDNSGVVKLLASNAATTNVTTFSAGTTGFTPSTATSGAVTLAGTLAIANGGTNSTATATAGAIAYGTGTAYAFTSAGTTGQVLTSNGASAPTWSSAATGTVTSVGGTGTVNGITLTGTVTSSGSLTLGGTLDLSSPPAIGGTTPAAGTFTVAKATEYIEKSTAISASNIDLSAGNYFTKTISGTTTFTISNPAASGLVNSFILQLTNGGSATVNWFSGVKWAGGTAPTLTASGYDELGFFSIDGGTTWQGFVLGKAMA